MGADNPKLLLPGKPAAQDDSLAADLERKEAQYYAAVIERAPAAVRAAQIIACGQGPTDMLKNAVLAERAYLRARFDKAMCKALGAPAAAERAMEKVAGTREAILNAYDKLSIAAGPNAAKFRFAKDVQGRADRFLEKAFPDPSRTLN